MKYLIALLLAFPAMADIATVTWSMAVANADGSPVVGVIDRTNIWCGPQPGAYNQLLSIPADLSKPTNTADINYTGTMYCAWQLVIILPDGQEIAQPRSAEQTFTAAKLPLPMSDPIVSTTKTVENCATTITTKRACGTTTVPQQGGIIVRTQ